MIDQTKENKLQVIVNEMLFNKVIVNENIIKIVLGKGNVFLNFAEKVELIISDKNKKEYIIDCSKVELENGEICLLVDINEWALKTELISCEYDVYIKYKDNTMKLKSVRSGSLSEKEEVQFLRLVVIDKQGMKFGVKLYCSEDKLLKIKINKLVEVKSVTSVGKRYGGIRIDGEMYIRRVSRVKEDRMYGEVEIPIQNNKSIKLFYTADVVLKEGKNTLYRYALVIDKDAIKWQGYIAKDILKMLRGNTIKCHIHGVDGKIEYDMNIDPEVMNITIGDRLRKSSIIKKLMG